MIATSSFIEKANFSKAQAFSSTIHKEMLSNLVSEWTFDELTPDGKTKDTWGGKDGTIHGATQVDDCVYGKCYSFNGSDNYIDFGNILRPSRTEDRTFSFWVKLNSYGGTVFSTGNIYYNKAGYSLLRLLQNHISYSYDFHVSPYIFDFNHSMDLNNWRFFVVSFERDSPDIKFILYRDGLFKGIDAKEQTTDGQTNSSFKIGCNFQETRRNFLDGFIDDFRVYNSALSSAQIKQNYIAGLNSLLANGTLLKDEYNARLEALASN